MLLNKGKALSKLVGIWTFLLLLILKGAFPKAAYAFLSSLDSCAAQPQCAAAISSEVAPAVTAPTGAGFGASTLTTTTATGASTSVNAVAGVTVVGDMRLSGIAAYYLWNQAVNTRAQVLAKQRYCAAYPLDVVCGPPGQSPGIKYHFEVTFNQYYNGKYRSTDTRGATQNSVVIGPIKQIQVYYERGYHNIAVECSGKFGGGSYYQGKVYYNFGLGTGPYSYVITNIKIWRADGKPDTAPPALPWKDWPQQKRSIAVASLTNSDWLGLIPSMPVGGKLNPGDKINAPTIVIPGQEEDDPNTPADERILRKEPGFFTNPGGPDTDFDKDGSPDSADPEPQNPNIPTASSNPPSDDTPSEGEQAVDQVRESYDDFLDNPENASYRDRLDAIEEKYRRAADMDDAAASDPDAGYEQDRLISEADSEFRQLENEIGEAWWSSLSQYEQQLFDGRTQAEINEMRELMKEWDKGTFDDVAHNIVHHAPNKGYEDPLEYLRDASSFKKSQAARIPSDPNKLRDDGTVRWVVRDTGEYRIETPDGKTLTYGFDQY